MRTNGNWRSLRTEVDRLFEDFFGGLAFTTAQTSNGPAGPIWTPAVDLSEDKDSFAVRAELPGIDPGAVEIELQDNILSIRGERREERKEEKKNYHLLERSYGSFFRSFTLPRNINADAVKATFENGVLSISVPKTAEARPRKVKVETVTSAKAAEPKVKTAGAS
jgi:HSP20 family protein